MGVQVIFNQDTTFGIRKMLVNQLIDANSPIDFGALLGDFDMTPIQQRRKEHEQISCSLSPVLVVITFWTPFLTGML